MASVNLGRMNASHHPDVLTSFSGRTDETNSGVLDETRETIKSAKNTINYVGDSKNMGETMDAIKEMLRSISALVDELKLTVVESKQSGTIHNIEETIRETRSAFTEHR